jgi:protein-tyrosine phosphatase
MAPSPTPLVPAQLDRLQRFNVSRSVDIHCHVLPGVDDGPRNLSESLALCRMLIEDGFTDVIATPHQLGRLDGTNQPPAVRQAVAELQTSLTQANIPMRIHPGGEVRLDERIPKLLADDKVSCLTDAKKYLLLELMPNLAVDPGFLVPYLTKAKVRIVLAHGERYDALVADLNAAQAWAMQPGLAIQVNAPTFLGGSGEAGEAAAWEWLARGWVKLVATDAHSTNKRRPRMSEAIERIVERAGEDVARRVCAENPARLLAGDELL